jgi:hypothetical protein
VYLFALLFVMNQKSMYVALLRDTGLWPAGEAYASQLSRQCDGLFLPATS